MQVCNPLIQIKKGAATRKPVTKIRLERTWVTRKSDSLSIYAYGKLIAEQNIEQD